MQCKDLSWRRYFRPQVSEDDEELHKDEWEL